MNVPGVAVEKKVGVVGCKDTTLDFMAALARAGLRFDHCITIGPDKGEEQQVAGYCDLRPHLERIGTPCTLVERYSLKSDRDRDRCLALGLDAVFVIGWQRLIPEWFLERLRIGAFGMHGASKPLPFGRGRSPLNWSLIQGRQLFFTHLFQYLPGVDDGPVIDVQVFDITPYDTCLTLHHKNTLAMIRLCERHLAPLLNGTAVKHRQQGTARSQYPKRTPEDGLIYWEDCSNDIYNLLRAVTRPFAGAFGFLDDDPSRKLTIWRAVPFDTHITWPSAAAGEIVHVFVDGTFVVKTGDTSIFVQEYEGPPVGESHIGHRIGNLGTPRKIWENLPI
jgi:methionyl-tRNA formyltransferase